jgi:hypothetical protein
MARAICLYNCDRNGGLICKIEIERDNSWESNNKLEPRGVHSSTFWSYNTVQYACQLVASESNICMHGQVNKQ